MTTGVLTTSFPRHPGDFAGCFVEDTVRAYAAAGETVDVVAAGAQPLAPDFRPDFRPDLGPRVRVMRVRPPAAPGARPLFFGDGAPEALESGGLGAWLQACGFWAALCERVRPLAPTWDRIVAHWLVPSALAAHAVAPRLPLTAYAHSGDVALLERIPGGPELARRLAWQTDDLIFVSADLRNRFTRLCGIETGRVGPHLAVSSPRDGDRPTCPDSQRRKTRLALGVTGRTLLSVGRLVPIKGFDILLRAVATAATESRIPGSDFMTVVILGEGPERNRLDAMARRMNLDLRLPGCVPRPEVGTWMTAADLYVQPSRRLSTGRTEGLPVATLEALHAGLPVIASRTGGLAALGTVGASIVPPENVGALAAAVRGFASHGGLAGREPASFANPAV